MKKITTLFLFFMFVLNIARAETEPNNVWNQSNLITLGATGSGTADLNYDEDWWRIITPSDGKLTLTWSSLNGSNVYCQIYDTLGVQQFASAYTSGSNSVLNVDGLAKGNYYVRFIAYFISESTTYNFVPTFTAVPVPNENEPNDVFTQANTFAVNDSVTGHIGYFHNSYDDLTDWWKITTTLDGRIDFTIYSLNSQNVYAELFASDGVTLLVGSYTTTNATYSKDGLAPGVYYIRIRNYFDSEFSPYALKNNLVLPINTAETGSANDSPAQAKVININDSINGHVGYNDYTLRDTLDWYKFTTTLDGQINISLNVFNNQNVYAQLFDGDGVTVLTGSYTTTSAIYSRDGLAAGTYYIRIINYYSNAEWAPYSIRVTQVTTVPNDAEPNGTRAQALNLNLNDSVTGHIGYYYNGNDDLEDWYKVTTTADGQLNVNIYSLNNQNVYALLYDNDGVTYLTGSYTTTSATYSINGLAAGTYYIQIKNYYNNEWAPYALKATFNSASNNDIESNGSPATALLLPINSNASGHINYYYNLARDTFDFYSVTLPVDGKFSWTINSLNGQNVFATLFDHDGITVLADNYTTSTLTQTLNNLGAGTYFIRIRTYYGNEFAPYTLSNVLEPMNFLAENTANNDVATQGTLLPANTPTGGHIYFYYNLITDPQDWWKIGYDGNGTMNLQLDVEQNHFNTDLPYINYDLFSDTTLAPIYTGQVHALTNTISMSGLSVGKYYLKISSSYATFGAYQLTASYTERCLSSIVVGASSQTTGCQGNITYNLSGGLAPYSVQLYKGGVASGVPLTGNNSVIFSGLGIGTYTAKVYSFGASGSCNNASASTTFSLPAVPTITAGGATTFCQGGNVTLTSSSAATYLWSTGATTQAISATTNGNYSVTIANAAGCSATSATTSVTVNALPSTPTIISGGATTFCQGGSVTLTSSAATSYVWSTGATTQAISATANGSFSVTVTNANGCSATSATTTVTVNANPIVSLSALASKCTTDAAFALSGGSPAGGTYSGTGVSGGQFNPATAGVGTFVISYSFTNANGCSASATQNISVANCGGCTPTISTNGSTTFCQGGSVILTASSGINYLWSTGATTQAITANTNGNFSVTVTNANNCTGTSGTTTVTVNALPSTPTITAGGATTFCQGGSVTLTSSAATSYVWSTGATTQAISATANGNYSVTVKNASGCSATSLVTVVTVTANVTASISGNTSVCLGSATTLLASTGNTFAWSTGATTQSINVSPTTNTSYTVTITSAGGCTSSASATVTVSHCGGSYCNANGLSKNKGYIYKVRLNSISNTSGWNGGYANFLTTSTTLTKGNAYSVAITPGYSSCSIRCLYTRVWIDWNQDGDFNDPGELVFAPIGSSFFPRFGSINVPASALNGTTRMRVAMRYGAIPTPCGTFNFGEVEDYTITVNSSSVRIDDSQITNTQNNTDINFVIYPNPVGDVLSIQFKNADGSLNIDQGMLVELLDLNGKTILQTTLQATEKQIDVSQLQAGVYFVRMIAKENNVNVNTKLQRVIITH